MAPYRSSFVYLSNGLGAETRAEVVAGVWAGVEVEVQKIDGVGLEVPLLLLGAPPTLRRVQSPSAWLAR